VCLQKVTLEVSADCGAQVAYCEDAKLKALTIRVLLAGFKGAASGLNVVNPQLWDRFPVLFQNVHHQQIGSNNEQGSWMQEDSPNRLSANILVPDTQVVFQYVAAHQCYKDALQSTDYNLVK
jgi:hypothetical protein